MPTPPPYPHSPRARSRNRIALRNLLAGALLGTVAWGLSRQPQAGGLQLALALAVVLAGSASTVFLGLGLSPGLTRADAAKRARQGTMCVACGILLAMHALNLLS